MTTTVARIYESYGNALEASNGLRHNGFNRDEIDLISRAANSEDGEIVDLSAEIAKAGIPADRVASYVASVDAGKALLVVRAAFGAARKAMTTVDNHGPIAADAGNAEYYVSMAQDPATFSLSAYFNLPVLLSDATPFSRFWNMPVLLSSTKAFLGLERISKGFTFGVPKLLNNGSLLSDELNIPVLWDPK
jgi:hypothetical protein